MTLLLVSMDEIALPVAMTDLELRRIDTGARARWRLTWTGGQAELALRSIHVQRAGSSALAAALPGVAPSWRGRIGWAVLLYLVRVPGVTRVLQVLRGAG
jgi:hypothetical protein